MQFFPFASLDVAQLKTAKFQSWFKFARLLGGFSVMGLYLSLLVAAIRYLTFDPVANPLQSAASVANVSLLVGLSTAMAGLALSAAIAYLVMQQNQALVSVK